MKLPLTLYSDAAAESLAFYTLESDEWIPLQAEPTVEGVVAVGLLTSLPANVVVLEASSDEG